MKIFNKNNTNNALKHARPYVVSVFDFLLSCIIYFLNALNHARIRARMEPFIFLASAATIIYAIFAYRQWEVMRGQLNEIQISHRPWVTADVSSIGIIYTKDGVHIPLQFVLRNTGLNPAVDTLIVVHAFAIENDLGTTQAVCRNNADTVGLNVFPNEHIRKTVDAFIYKSELDDLWKEIPMMAGVISPTISACIIYKTAGNEKAIHHTPFVFSLRQSNGLNIRLHDGQFIPSSNLELRNDLLATGRAD